MFPAAAAHSGFPTRRCSFSLHFILSLLSPQLVLSAPAPASATSPRSRVPLTADGVRDHDLGAGCAHCSWGVTASGPSQQTARGQGFCSVITGLSVLMGRVPFTPVSGHNIAPQSPRHRVVVTRVTWLLTQASGTMQLNGPLRASVSPEHRVTVSENMLSDQ